MSLGTAVRQLQQQYSTAQIREMIRLYTAAYGNSGMNARQVLEEMVCDAMGKMNAFATEETSSVAGEVGQFLRDLRKEALETQTDGQKNNAQEGVKYSREMEGQTQQEITQRYQQEVDQVLNAPYTTARQLIVGYTPTVYRQLGMPSLPLTIGSGHVYSAAKTEAEAKQDGNYKRGTHYHGLGDAALKNIYKAIQDPVMVIAAKDVNKNVSPLRSTHSVVAIVDIGTAKKSLLVPIEITAERTVNGTQMDVNTISSVYERNVGNLGKEAIALENSGDVGVYYAKKEAMTLPVAGVRFPAQLQQSIASNGIIHRFSEKVNMNISENVQSQQFKRWFGDWQNDPANASKVVNADGTPKVMYHGTNEDFTVFDRSKGKKKIHLNVLGDGNYFTALEQGATRYGSNVVAAYLDIKNPYVKADGFNTVADQIASEFGIARDSFTGKDVSSILRRRGYDGVVMYDGNGEIVIANAFSSNQIKSATDNIGTFDGKNPDIRYSRELDSEYMELAKDPEGNSTELRKMVDQAAEQQGYKTLFYHGSKKGGGFTEFRDWQYFTPKKEYAERYAQRGNPDSLYSVFVKMENPFDTRNAKARRIFQEARDELGLGEIQDTGLPDWTDGYDLADYIDENGLNYDAIVLDEGGDLVNGKPVSRGLSYVVRKSNQVKSADAVVYDDNGKVIPLSERFNSDKRDIRYSRELTTDGRIVAVVDEDILSNLDLSNWNQETKEAAQKAAAAALLKFQDGIAVEGITRKVNRISRKEFTRSEYTNELFWWNSTAFLDKMRAANNLDDVVIATTDWARDGKLKHPRTDNFVDFDHGTTLIASGDAKYEAEVVVGITDKGDAVFYDIVNMKQGNFSIKKEESSPTATTNKSPGSIFEDSSKKNVAQQSENVKQKYSRELELDSEGNALTQEQTDFFADSEVRNDDGELIPVYHKTTESFTVFQRGKLGKETLGNADDASLAATSLIGHWFSDSENTPFMGNAMKTYLNIKKPYYTSLDELAADMGDFSGDLEMMQDHFDRGQYNMVREAARSYVRWMKWKGYDGLIVNDTETGGTSYVILNSNQAKLTDNGNPTSKRDIRYSRELETVEALKRQNEILQKQRDYWKEQTRTTDEKTRGADKGEVRSLAGQLIRQYSSKTEVEEILPEMQWLADSIWRNDPKISYTDLQDSAQNIARMVLDGSEVNLNAENWETGQELKRFLRGRYINVDESLKEDIGDFKNFKRSNRSLHFRENGTGTGVASLWLELQNDFGKGLFPDSISNPGDQIRHIADTLTSLTESDMRNPYAADMELTVEQMAYDVMARAAGLNRQKATKTDNTADSPLLYSVRMLTWAEVSWSMLPSS